MLRTKTELFLGELPPRDRPAGTRVGVVRSDRRATLLTAVSCNVQRKPQRHMESARHPQLEDDVPD